MTTLSSASNSGTAITLASARNFINNAGNNALDASNGRWLVYSTTPTNNVTGGLNPAFLHYDCTYGGSCTLGSGNGLFYSYAPVLTATPTTISLTYGDGVPDLSHYNYTLSGYLGSDASHDMLSGSLVGSTNYTQGANIGSYAINYLSGALNSTLGYTLNYASGALSVSPPALTTAFVLPPTVIRVSQNPMLNIAPIFSSDISSTNLSGFAGNTSLGAEQFAPLTSEHFSTPSRDMPTATE